MSMDASEESLYVNSLLDGILFTYLVFSDEVNNSGNVVLNGRIIDE
jgi:hypothetical protein